MRWYSKLAIYLIFFLVVLYFFVVIYESISGIRTEMLIEGIISGKLWTAENLFIVFAISIVLMIFKKFVTAVLKTGIFVTMKEKK